MDNQIIISRYNEDISWIHSYRDISLIYNKGINNIDSNIFNVVQLKNVGRESHTYLYHIVNNYEKLAENTIFFQGNISDHKILNMTDYLNNNKITAHFENISFYNLKNKIEHKGKWQKEYNNGVMLKESLTPYDWLKNVIGIVFEENIDIIKVIWGANFAVSKDLIKSKPKSFYQNILRYIEHHVNPELGHYIERSWYIFFNFNFIIKKTIKYLFIKDNIDNVYTLLNNYLISKPESEFEEIHLWIPIRLNENKNKNYKIYCTSMINNYIEVNPIIYNNEFYFDIMGINNVNILIEFDNNENKYEILISKKSFIKDLTESFIYYYENNIINNNSFTRVYFNFNENIIVRNDENIIFQFDNPNKELKIKKIKIRNSKSNTFWNYEHNGINNNKIKIFYCNNFYFNPKIFYNFNYLDYYIEKLDLIDCL
jgi:hypothetical protein